MLVRGMVLVGELKSMERRNFRLVRSATLSTSHKHAIELLHFVSFE